jgi:hypothetical protein
MGLLFMNRLAVKHHAAGSAPAFSGLNSGKGTSFGSSLTLGSLDWFTMAMSWTNVIDSDDPTSDVGLGLTLGFGACKESAPGSLIVGVQSMISFIVANTR